MSLHTRRSQFSGTWYPDTSRACEREIKKFLKNKDGQDQVSTDIVGGIVPHAGWFFSGEIACDVIHRMATADPPDVIIVFGMHLHPQSPNYMMPEGAWETPFGKLSVNKRISKRLLNQFPFRVETPYNHTKDNTIELQLPFIKYFFPKADLLAIGLPPVESSLEIARITVDIARELGLRIKVIGSTDLTHYGYNYGFMPKGSGPSALKWAKDENDRRVIDAMIAMVPEKIIDEGINHQNACCAGAAAGAVAAAKQMGSESAKLIAYASSHDKNPDDSFVGYAGIVFS